MEKIIIKASKRDILGKKVGALRREGLIPGVMYGQDKKPIAITMNAREVKRAIQGLTPSSIVVLSIDGKEHPALIRERQRNYIRNEYIHLDFQAVSMKEKIRAKIEITLQGVAPAVKDFDGIVLQDKEFVEVEALPTDLPERFTVDISVLANIGDLIRVSELDIPENVTIFDDVNDLIVSVSGSAVSTEEAESDEESAGAEPEVVEKGKKEEDEA